MIQVALDSLYTAIVARKHSLGHTLATFFIPVGKALFYSYLLVTYSPAVVTTPALLIFAIGLSHSQFVSRLIIATVTRERFDPIGSEDLAILVTALCVVLGQGDLGTYAGIIVGAAMYWQYIRVIIKQICGYLKINCLTITPKKSA